MAEEATAMAVAEVNGVQLLVGLRSALAWLEANREQVNDLNVFPVPDGDTGSNMYLTLRSAVEEAQRARDPGGAASVMRAAAHGSLMGARGNSGVILSQILRGFAQGLADHAQIDGPRVAVALTEASAVAYRAVMKPTEGTVLTVIREAAGAAQAEADRGGDLGAVLDAAVAEAHAAVERTIDQLAVLREAGVVDAGGRGLAIILEGVSRAIHDPEAAAASATTLPPPATRRSEAVLEPSGAEPVRHGAAAVAERPQGWGYCTEFLIHGEELDVDAVRDRLIAGTDADSALVVGDGEVIRVHIHTFDPAELIARAAQSGRLSRLKVEDMAQQHHEVRERAAAAPRKALGVVAVAPGHGFGEILMGLGCDRVVEGGQTMNPSIEDLLNGVRQAGAENVILLPNNKNVIMTANHVDALAGDVQVRVVPTSNLPQGISALLALEPGGALDTNLARMATAIGQVRAVEVTRAVRDSTANGLEIKSGDVIALVDDEITEVGHDDLSVVQAVLQHLGEEPGLVTVYRGAQVGEAEASALVGALRSAHPRIEFELHEGGQEHYPYVLSVE